MKKLDDWDKKIQPNLDEKEIRIRKVLIVFGFLIIVAASVVLIYAIWQKQYPIAYVCIGCLILMIISWLKLNPKLHNSLRPSTKILPIKQDFNLVTFLTIVLNTKTPYGPPKLGFQMDDLFLRVPTYILADRGWIIYFYIRNQNIIFKTMRYRAPNSPEPTADDYDIVTAFQERLADYFCFVINENRRPEEEEIRRLFHDLPESNIR